ncbi:MAG: CvpA family protein [Chloroflexi bacterium]|nr:CvpA family protein [Chloroflexota bacterium]
MISISAFFWIMVMLFAVVGALRGWTREVIATSGLILALFAINQFGTYLASFVGGGGTLDTDAMRRQVFYLYAAIYLLIAFFSYQGPALAGARLTGKLRVRDNFQDKLMGMLVGGVNGYLIVGAMLAFLEFQLQSPGSWVRLPPGVQYPFAFIVRPTDVVPLLNNLPIPFLAPYLPFLVVIVFLFVIVVMI